VGRPVKPDGCRSIWSRWLDCWLGADHRYCKMLGADGATYLLRHDTARGRWELTIMKRRRGCGQISASSRISARVHGESA
jgi:hypothetical protein